MSSMPKVLEKTLKKMNISPSEAYRNKNFETARIGCELCYLRESDVEFMLDKNTSQFQANARLISRRRASA